jgi:uncharacterized protein
MPPSAALENVFVLPHEGRFMIYMPLAGIVMLGNAALVNSLHGAGIGDAAAAARLGLGESFFGELARKGDSILARMRDRTIPPFAPASVSLFLTGRCTFRCAYCYANGGDNPVDMEPEVARGVLREVADNASRAGARFVTVHFHGGGDVSAAWDSLVAAREYLSALCSERALAARTSVGSNGFLDKGQRAWIAENIGSATISVDGLPAIQDLHRPLAGGGGSSALVDETLRDLDRSGYPYSIRMTVSARSVGTLAESVEFLCANYAAKRIKAEPLFPRGRASDSPIAFPDADEFVSSFRKARAVARARGRELVFSGVRTGTLSPIFCQAAGMSCAVTPEGNVTSCYEVLFADDPLAERFFYGRYDKAEGRMIVDEERRRKLFDLTVFGRESCDRCFCKFGCSGDCPAKALLLESVGASRAPDRCRIIRELTKDELAERLDGGGGKSAREGPEAADE